MLNGINDDVIEKNNSSSNGVGSLDLNMPSNFIFTMASPSVIRKRKRVCRRKSGGSLPSSPVPNLSAQNSSTKDTTEEISSTMEVGNAISFKMDGFEDNVRQLISNSGAANVPK